MKSFERAHLVARNSFKFGRERPSFCLRNFDRSLWDKILPTVSSLNFNPLKYGRRKLSEILNFYDGFSGMKEVRLAQEKVEEAGARLSVMQAERQRAFAALLEIQNKLKGIYAELETTKRGDDRYIHLITEEHRLTKQEEMQQEKFKDIEKAERDQFTLFSHSVKATHEKEKAQAQKTKYWSIIGSIMGTMIGIIGSSLNNNRKQSELRRLISESSNTKLELELNKFLEVYRKTEMSKYGHETTHVRSQVLNDTMSNKTSSDNNVTQKYLDELLSKTNTILINLEETLKILKNINNFELNVVKSTDGSFACIPRENNQLIGIIWNSSLIIAGSIFATILFNHFFS